MTRKNHVLCIILSLPLVFFLIATPLPMLYNDTAGEVVEGTSLLHDYFGGFSIFNPFLSILIFNIFGIALTHHAEEEKGRLVGKALYIIGALMILYVGLQMFIVQHGDALEADTYTLSIGGIMLAISVVLAVLNVILILFGPLIAQLVQDAYIPGERTVKNYAFTHELKKWKKLFDADTLTAEEYEHKKDAVLAKVGKAGQDETRLVSLLKKVHENGLIDETDFQKKKKEILDIG